MLLRLTLALFLGLLVLPLGIAGTAGAVDMRAEFVGASDTFLDNPHDLKLTPDGKYLFVSDVDNDRVAVLDPETLKLVANIGNDHQDGTHDVEFDEAGRLYVADTNNNRVTIYEMDGLKAKLIGEFSDRIRGPEGVLAHPNGLIYVAGAWSNNVVAYNMRGKIVSELGGLSSPHDLERAPNGDIWLADAGNDRMLLLSTDLKIRKELKGAPYHFNGVRYQDVLPDGTLIAADKYSHQVKIIGPGGKVLLVLGTGEAGMGPGKFKTPEGVEVQGNMLYLSDSGNDRVVKYRLHRE